MVPKELPSNRRVFPLTREGRKAIRKGNVYLYNSKGWSRVIHYYHQGRDWVVVTVRPSGYVHDFAVSERNEFYTLLAKERTVLRKDGLDS